MMQVVPLPAATAFLERAAPVLQSDPAANNLPLGIAQNLIDEPGSYDEALFWVVEREGTVVGAALRTPPYPLVLAEPVQAEVIDALVSALVDGRSAVPGVTANEPWATRFAEAWEARTGATWDVAIGQGVYALTSVRAPRSAPGSWRQATVEDRPLLLRWMHEFEVEALQAMTRDERATERALETRLGEGDTSGFSLWIDEGGPVSLSGWTHIPGGARIGPVYTPPGERGRGYASNLVAEVSRSMLGSGAPACFLYTDLGNPTSNSIYRRIGYDQVAESSMIRFREPSR
jgi:uncharacterized protein